MKQERTLPDLAVIVMVHEVMPRWKTHGFAPPDEFVGILMRMEFDKKISRHELRSFLDRYYEDVEQGECKHPEAA